MPGSTPPISTEPDNGPAPARPRWPWALAAVAAVAGLVAGGAIVAGFGIDGNANAQAVRARATPSVTVTGPPASSPSSGTDVHISQSCLQAISDAEQVYGQLGQLVKAASSLNAASLDTVVRRLQALQSELHPAATACHATVALPSAQPVPSSSPATARTAAAAS